MFQASASEASSTWENVQPQTGIPIQIPTCVKAHGCRHACVTLSRYTKSCYVETKYDGQRMQIHVDLSLPQDKQIQIFSKSRKDSTRTRQEIIP
jgi:DNA ligase 4